jgi:hypothetical protein
LSSDGEFAGEISREKPETPFVGPVRRLLGSINRVRNGYNQGMGRRFQFRMGALFKLMVLVGVLLIVGQWAAMLSDRSTAMIVFVVLLSLWAPTCFGA